MAQRFGCATGCGGRSGGERLVRVERSIRLPASPERVWREVQRSDLLMYVAAPLIRFQPIDPPSLPEIWSEGRYQVEMRLFGLLPLGRQWIVISHPEAAEAGVFHIRDNGAGGLAKRWDHLISIRPAQEGGTLYTDRVEVEAGLLTPFVALFASLFYAHRQSRWLALAQADFNRP